MKQLNGIVIGWSKIVVRRSNINSSQSQEQFVTGEHILINTLNDDNLEDEDFLHESLKDIRTLAELHGDVSSVNGVLSGEQKGSVCVLNACGHEVMGLREVARGIRAHKVKMIVMADNLYEYGAIDTKLQEILDLACVQGLPVLYKLNKPKPRRWANQSRCQSLESRKA